MRHISFEILLIFVISTAILLFIALCSDLMFESNVLYYGKWMHFDYIKTVENFSNINLTAPYCWRLLVPFLVYMLPFSIEIGYFVITYFCIIVSSVLIYFIVKHLFVGLYYPWIGVLTYFSLIYVVRINAIEFISVDALAFTFILLSIFSIYKKKNLLFIVSTALGILTKETLFVVFPLYFTINYMPNQNRKFYNHLIYNTFILLSPAIIIYILLIVIIVPNSNYNYLNILIKTTQYRFDSFLGMFSTLNKDLFANQNNYENSLINLYRISLGAIGPILYFIILKAYKIRNYIIRLSPLLVLSFLQIFIAEDNERLVAVGFPAYILLYLFAIQSFVIENKINIKYFLIYSLANVVLQFFLTNDHYWQTYYSVVFQLILGLMMLAIIYSIRYVLLKKQINSSSQIL